MTRSFSELSNKIPLEVQKLAREKQEMSELKVIQDPIFDKVAGVRHAFFTRKGGVSTGVHSSLNCCYRGLDSSLNVRENRKRVMNVKKRCHRP